MDAALTTTLDTLLPLLQKVAEVHGPSDPRLLEVFGGYSDLHRRLAGGLATRAEVEDGLGLLRHLTDGFTPPEGACRSYRRALADLEWVSARLPAAAADLATGPTSAP